MALAARFGSLLQSLADNIAAREPAVETTKASSCGTGSGKTGVTAKPPRGKDVRDGEMKRGKLVKQPVKMPGD